MTLCVDNLNVSRGRRVLLQEVSFDVAPGEMLAVIGPNGAGKSTLLHAVIGDIAIGAGRVTFAGRPVADYERRDRARRMALLSQANQLGFAFAVRDVIALARSPHASGRAIDMAIVDEAAAAADVTHLLGRSFTRLSGGEKQRVHLARVLAQVWRAEDADPRLLLLDEPVAALDIGHQSLLMAALSAMAARGVAIVLVGHDVTLAAAHADRLLALRDGHVIAHGAPSEVVTETTLASVYSARTRVVAHPDTGAPVVLYA